MNVVSLFDGGSMGQVALDKAGIKIDNYFASEIEKEAMIVAMDNYPNTIQIGDVRNVSYKDGVYRYPTRRECELMQNLPIGYTKAVGYRIATGIIGNGWTVDAIAHIYENLAQMQY